MRPLFGLLLLPFWADGAEFGVHWNSGHVQPAESGWVAQLSQASARWVRFGPGPAAQEFAHSVLWWPGATPYRPPDSPDLYQSLLATNLWTVYRQAREHSPLAPGEPGAVEIGNEPDLHFTPDLPDRMAATLKAAWWGLKTSRPELPVLLPAAAATPGPYFEQLLANGAGAFTDGWNFHFYGWAQDFAPSVDAHRRFLDRHGLSGLPLWLTEYGFAGLPAGDQAGHPTLLGRQQAFFERTTAEGALLGVHRQFAFCLQPHLEGGLDFSLRDATGAARPALESWLTLTSRLRPARPRYQLVHEALKQTVGWVWELPAGVQEPARWWTQLFTPHRRAEPALPERPRAGSGASAEPVNPITYFEFQLQFPPGVRPVRIGLQGEGGTWTEESLHFNAMSSTNLNLLTRPGRFEVAGCRWEPVRPARLPAPPRTAPSPVVVTLRPEGPGWQPDKARLAYRHGNALPLGLELRLHNFGSSTGTGRWDLQWPAGWCQLSGPDRGRARLKAQTDLTIPLHALPPPGGGVTPWPVRLRWRGDDGRTDVAVIRVCPAGAVPGTGPSLGGWWTDPETGCDRREEGDRVTFTRPARAFGDGLSLVLPLPGDLHLRADTVLRFRYRTDSALAQRRRLTLITPEREWFRHDEDRPVTAGWQTDEVRVGDFTPAFWSRIGPGDPARAGYFGLAITRLRPGESVTVGPVTVIGAGGPAGR